VLVIIDLSGVQRHPQPDPFLVHMGIVVCVQRPYQHGRKRFHQYALWYFGRNQDENTVPAILAIAVGPRYSRQLECFLHRTVEALSDRDLVPVGAAFIAEPLNVYDDHGPVNGQPLVLYLPTPR